MTTIPAVPELAAALPRPEVRSIRTRLTLTIASFGTLAVVTCLLAPLIGSTPISLARVFDRSIPFADNVDAQIFFVARLPRVLAGALVGAALSAAGVVFQAMLRNPLATPFTLGVSAGASLGAVLAIVLGASAVLGPLSPVPLASLAGATIAGAIVYWLAKPSGRAMSTTVLLLAGVTLNSFFSALIMFVQYIADFAQVYRATRWLMGDLDVGGFQPLAAALPLVVIAMVMFALLPSALNLLSVGNDAAASRGVDVAAAQRLAFISASIATSAAVSLGGPIGFVGIVVPHLVRLIVGVDHRIVLPASALFGAAFLVACDLAARTLLAPVEIPVGVITAMIGGPFFLWLLVQTRLIAAAAIAAFCSLTPTALGADQSAPASANAQPAQAPQRAPARIVSLVPALTEMLFAIGAGPQVVGVSSFDAFPPDVQKLPRVGALLNPDLERIFSLRPDLAITYGSQSELEAQLARAGIQTFSYRHGGITTVLDSIRDLGRVTGHRDGADRLVRDLQSRLAAVRMSVRDQAKPRVLLVFERQAGTLQNIFVSGGIGFLHEMLEAAGGTNVFADVKRESVQPSHETLLTRAPDVIIEVRAIGLIEGAGADDSRRVWATLPSLPAVRSGRIYLLTGEYLVVPGPRLAQATEAFAKVLHGGR